MMMTIIIYFEICTRLKLKKTMNNNVGIMVNMKETSQKKKERKTERKEIR